MQHHAGTGQPVDVCQPRTRPKTLNCPSGADAHRRQRREAPKASVAKDVPKPTRGAAWHVGNMHRAVGNDKENDKRIAAVTPAIQYILEATQPERSRISPPTCPA